MRFPLLIALILAFASMPPDASATANPETPAQLRLRQAQEDVNGAATEAARARGWVEVAAAHTARARESGDGSHYGQALQALEAARNAGGSTGLRKIEAWVRLGRHEFRLAADLARQQVDAAPDDHEAWGLLGDALMELGRYDRAADAYQHGMDLRPGPGAYLRAAYYRERMGDFEGARSLLTRAHAATAPRESEQLAWLDVQLAAIENQCGRTGEARGLLERSLRRFPDYHYALAALAELHLQEGRPEAAQAFARRALEIAPHAERWLVLADALRAGGEETAAREAEDRFETAALSNVDSADNENDQLVAFYLERRGDPERAREIANRQASSR